MRMKTIIDTSIWGEESRVGMEATSPTDRDVHSCRVTGCVGMLTLVFRFVFGTSV